MIKPPFSDSDKQFINETINRLDGIIIFPTETFYGIGCSALSDIAVDKIYRLKQRKKNSPLLVLINSWEMLEKYFQPVPETYHNILKKYWPGPLTAILKSRGNLSGSLNVSGKNIAVRMTSCETTRQLIEICSVPIVGTSANLSGQQESIVVHSTIPVFKESVDIYIDGGKTPGGLASTLVDMTAANNIKIIRQGSIFLNPAE